MRRIFSNNAYFTKLPKSFCPRVDVCIEQQPDTKERFKELLDIIYSSNPTLGYPQGDLAIWLSQNANPEIKAFIEQNLVHNIGEQPALELSADLQNKLREVVSDDDIARFYRRKNETREEYSSRLYEFLNEQKRDASYKRTMKRLKDLADVAGG